MLKFLKKRKRRHSAPEKSALERINESLPDLPRAIAGRIESVLPFTMTSIERISALIDAVDYVVDQQIQGDFVECGVWRGGSMMAIAKTLLSRNQNDRQLWLYDTFEGMSAPEACDIDHVGSTAAELLKLQSPDDPASIWCQCSLEEVRTNLDSTGYPDGGIRYVKGPVEKTLPEQIPKRIALLRLDTDWYQSTKHELTHLFPRLVDGGVLVIDDYGHWKGCRKAVDEYIKTNKISILLNRIDYTGRMGLKMPMGCKNQENPGLKTVA